MALVHFDEIAFMNYNWIVVPTAVNAMLAASQNARKAGMPSVIIFTTTAGNPETKQGEYALRTLQSALPFTKRLYDCDTRNHLLAIIAKSSSRSAPMLYLEFSYRQLGKTDEWFRINASRSGASQDDINRDFLNIWQCSSDNAIIPEAIRQSLLASKREPLYVEISDDFIVNWYVPQTDVESVDFRHKKMIMGSDTSENIGKDFTTFTMISVSDMAVIATFRCNNSNTMVIARFVATMLLKYTSTVFIPERQNTGIVITDFVIEELQKNNINPYTRVYNDVVQNVDEDKYKNVNMYDYNNIPANIRGMFGYRTGGAGSQTSRSLLYKQVMFKTLELNSTRVYDRTLVNEFVNLTTKGGRIDHANGRHDDQIISYLLACYLIFFGKHLERYGIEASDVLNSISTVGDSISPSARDYQIAIRRRIKELETLIAAEPPFALKQSYLREMNNLRPMVNERLISVKPVAVAQVNYQEKQMGSVKTNVDTLRSFTNRFLRSR